MKDCCSHHDETFSEIFKVLINNYIPIWVIFSVICFVAVFYASLRKKSVSKAKQE